VDDIGNKMGNKMNDEIEQSLKAALQREPAPSRLADRVLREAGAHPRPAALWWRLPIVRWATVGVVAMACVAGALSEHARQRHIRGQQARQQVLLALRITGTKLRAVQEQVVKANVGGEIHR
jgi:hypothetical protein